MAESTNPSCFSCRWVPAPLWLQGAEGLGCCPALAEGSWDFFSPHLLSVSHRHIGPTAFKLPFATGTLENCVLGLVGMRRLSGTCSSCGPGPALPGWVLRATGLTDHLVQLPQQGQVSSAGSLPAGHLGSWMAFTCHSAGHCPAYVSSLHQNPQEPESTPASPQRSCCMDMLPATCYQKEIQSSTAPIRPLTSQPPYPHPKPSTELQTK